LGLFTANLDLGEVISLFEWLERHPRVLDAPTVASDLTVARFSFELKTGGIEIRYQEMGRDRKNESLWVLSGLMDGLTAHARWQLVK
jgi:hypothetical protein